MGLNIAVLANLKRNAPKYEGMSDDAWDDLDSDTTIDAICSALAAGGHTATFLEGNLSLIEELPKLKPDLCFNICEGHWGDSRESHVPALLEMLRIPYTGSGVLALALTLDKPMTKRVLAHHELPTPEFQVFDAADEPLDPALRFPMFVKPSREGTGMGVSAQSIARDEAELRGQLRAQLARYRQPILVERFIRGREVTVGSLGNGEGIRFLSPLEVNFAAYPDSEADVYTNRMKTEWAHEFKYLCPAPLQPAQVAELNRLTAAVFRVTGCRDVARVDFRLDAADDDKPYILEVNPLPGLYPGLSDLVLEAAAEDAARGVTPAASYDALINEIVAVAVRRLGPRVI
jgi:D-alanine-D-alanine ligase